jgi:hypothetical protein
LKNFPYNLQSDLIVAMNNDIPGTNHGRLWNDVVPFLKLIRDLICCFADDD